MQVVTVKRKSCPKCGGDLRAEKVEYGIEWVCFCGGRFTPEQLMEALAEKAAREKKEEGIMMQEVIDRKIDQVPPKPDTTGMSVTVRNKALHDYYELNKEAIIADYHDLGESAMLKRWKISWTSWHIFGVRWLPSEVKSYKKRAKAVPYKPRTEPAAGKVAGRQQITPELPPWNESWGDLVKIEWLRSIQLISTGRGRS